ncbi:hypothetical protein [Lysinibacillus odysseyi]|uniref:Uncharacterized protein n=1 Tax=Lysinibacillus odysseyi 34hs-1 = NBRC 100172 TaxID=1220589 RepID=A0A0A3IWR5_9BACI|nr:hypothetical protein [Lysinibacillus odysseyi]KGR89156.1 hypothetical protein CD32_00615 [Lysinibacillus odysseyi 34hs-1 = NBRC 100172]
MMGNYLIRYKGKEYIISSNDSLSAVTAWIQRENRKYIPKDEDDRFNPEYFTVKYLGNTIMHAPKTRY